MSCSKDFFLARRGVSATQWRRSESKTMTLVAFMVYRDVPLFLALVITVVKYFAYWETSVLRTGNPTSYSRQLQCPLSLKTNGILNDCK